MIHKTLKLLFFAGIIISLGLVSSCDKVKDPYNSTEKPIDTTTVAKTRKLLLEEFTGHLCVNCPKGALAIRSLHTDFPEKIISVAYHASTTWAKPEASPSIYRQDFRTPMGEAFVTTFNIQAFPSAMINRLNFLNNKHRLTNADVWRDTFAVHKDRAPDAFLTINNSYASGSSALTTTVTCEFLNLMTGSYNLVVFLTEDSIVAPQKNGSASAPEDPAYAHPHAANYVHMHMVRACISDGTGTGVQIVSGSAAAGDTVVKTFNYTLPATFNGAAPTGTSPVAKNCNVVAFIYNTATQEVIQAEEKKIQ